MIAKEISCHAPTKKNNYKPYPHGMRKIRISKKDRGVKVAEVNGNILGALNYYSLKTGKPVLRFQKALSYSSLPLSICKLDGTRRQTVKCKIERYIAARPRRSYQ